MKRIITIALVAFVSVQAFAINVVASTSWTGALALAAGADEVTVLAPVELTHPPEYELRPSDLVTIGKADVIIYAGYENMVPRLLDATQNTGARVIQVDTVNSYAQISAAVLAIADALGTDREANENLQAIRAYLDDWSDALEASGLSEKPIVVHVHQQPLAHELGLNIVGTFGPGPLEAKQIDDLTRLRPALIIDNGHNPVAAPLAETTGAPVATWYNFPGTQGSRTILDVFAVNHDALAHANEDARSGSEDSGSM